MRSASIGRPADLGKADGYRRDACSTRRRKDTGGSLLRKDAWQRVPTIRLRSRGGFAPPLYVFAKRTHRFGGRNSMDHAHCKILMSFAEGFCRWVRFGKRTHRRGVLRGEKGGI